jgi:uncharacterized protein
VYAPSRSNVLTHSAFPGRHLLFNAFTGSLLELGDAERAIVEPWIRDPSGPIPDLDPRLFDRLRDAGAIVPGGFDEVAALRMVRENYEARRGPLLITIAPTMQCNYRCAYCFEEHRHEFMSATTEDQLKAFIAKEIVDASYAAVTWFGGEPLLHVDCIVRVQSFIAAAADKHSIGHKISLVTNGHFLTRNVVRRLLPLGNWSAVQVTIDGDRDTHNSRRVARNGRGDFDRLMENLRSAMDEGLPLSIRMNVDATNSDQSHFDRAVDALLAARVIPYASVAVGAVSASTDINAHVAPDVLSRRAVAQARARLRAALLRNGLPTGTSLPQPYCGALCTVEAKKGYTIAPSGLIFKCWNEIHLSEDHAVGHVSGRPIDRGSENLARWRAHDALSRSGCQNCTALGVCMGGCPWENRKISTEEHAYCGEYKFYPEELIRLAHAERSRK